MVYSDNEAQEGNNAEEKEDDSPTKKHKNNGEPSEVSEKRVRSEIETQTQDTAETQLTQTPQQSTPSEQRTESPVVPVSSSDGSGTSGKSYEILRTLLTSPHKTIVLKETSPSQVTSQTADDPTARLERRTGK